MIKWQLVIGTGLVVFGALLLVIFHAAGLLNSSTSSDASLFGSVATSVLAIGAAVLPSTAAGAASARILRQQGTTGTRASIIQTKATAGDKVVTATIATGDTAVGAYVQTAQGGATGFTDPPVPAWKYIEPVSTTQTVQLPIPDPTKPLAAGDKVRVVVQDSGVRVFGDVVSV